MIRRFLGAALLVGCVASSAFAQDARVLAGRGDVAFAEKLRERGLPDLAAKLLDVIEGAIGGDEEQSVLIRRLRLDLAQDDALLVADLDRREEALRNVLAAKERFVDEFDASPAAEATRESLPDLCLKLGEVMVEISRRDAGAALGAVGVPPFMRAEDLLKTRIAKLEAIEAPTDDDVYRLEVARYGLARALYGHALAFPHGSEQRIALIQSALAAYDEYDLIYDGRDNPSFVSFYAYIDVGLCLIELGRLDDALEEFDKPIALRERWGPRLLRTGVFPIPDDARDVVELICRATLQKAIALRDAKRLGEELVIGEEYFDAIPRPFDAPSALRLAKAYEEVVVAADLTQHLDAPATGMPSGGIELTKVADRLFEFGRGFNGVESTRTSFVDWKPESDDVDDSSWLEAAKIYAVVVAKKPDTHARIQLGRCLGFLGRWVEAADVYAKLFRDHPVFAAANRRRLDPDVIKAEPELVWAYLEWGVAERLAAREAHDRSRLADCRDLIFVPLKNTFPQQGAPEVWWAAMYHLVLTMFDRGELDDAILQIDDLQRQHQVAEHGVDDTFGYLPRIVALKTR